MRLRCFLCLALLGLLPACSFGVGLVNGMTPRLGYAVQRDIAYAPGSRHSLDMYVPNDATSTTPVVLFFYGGRWQYGDRADYRFVGQAFASRGMITAIADYRLYPEVRYQGFLEDAAQAAAWVRQWARDQGTPERPIFLAGHSAGAYIAIMLATDDRWLTSVGMEPCRDLNGAVGIAGPYDFLPLTDTDLIDLFGPETDLPATQPINAIDGDEPPLFLVSGDDDRTVPPDNSTKLSAAVRARGGDAEAKIYGGLGHIGVVGTLAWLFRTLAPTLDDTAVFIRDHAGSRKGRCDEPS